MIKQKFERSPYTLASDLIRAHSETQISRLDASLIREVISKALGLDDELVAQQLATYYEKNKELIDEKVIARIIKKIN